MFLGIYLRQLSCKIICASSITRGMRHVGTKGWTVLGVAEDETTKQRGLMIWMCQDETFNRIYEDDR